MDERGASGEAAETAYDVVIVGGGMGGLTTGALLARAGKKVLVVDEQQRPGGHAHAIRQDGYTFDSAVHLITRCSTTNRLGIGVIDALLNHLGVRDRCEFLPVGDPFYTVHFPDLTLAVPTGRDAYLAAHLQHFPGEAPGLRRLVDLSAQIAADLSGLPEEIGVGDLPRLAWRFPTLVRYRNATMKRLIDRELHDSRLKSAYATLWHWVGSPPSRASFLAWAAMMGHYIEDGAYYCRGGYQTLADAVTAALERAGGELVLGSRVTRILASERRVQGVTLDTGQRIAAPVVISNADPRVTFRELLGESHLPARMLRKLRRLELSISVLAAYVATDLDVRSLGAGHQNLYYSSWNIEQCCAEALAGGVPMLSLNIPTITDPSLAPPGQHIVMMMAMAPSDESSDAGLAEPMLSLAERLLPGLRDHLTAVVGVDRAAARGLALHRIGSIYGAAMTPAQVGAKRLNHQTAIHGLYLVGQWTQPGAGVPWVIQSGIQVARRVLGLSSVEEVLPHGLSPALAG